MNFEEKAREQAKYAADLTQCGIVMTSEEIYNAVHKFVHAALVSVQRETREADAKIGDRIASLHSNPAIIEGARQVVAAIRSQGTDHD